MDIVDKNLEAVEYLRSKKEYHTILLKLREKYKKTGKLTGRIKLENLTKEQGLLLGGIDHNLYVNLEGNLSVKKFIEHFSQGQFQGIDFIEVLNLYFPEELRTNREVREEKELKKEAYFQLLMNELQEEKTRLWLEAVFTFKKHGYGIIYKLYKENSKELRTVILNLDRALAMMSFSEENYMPLPAFSALVTRDSHYFDGNNLGGKLLISALSYLKGLDRCYTAEKISELLFSCGIVRDEVSNFVITSGLIIFNDKEELEGYKWFRRERQPLILSLYNLKAIDRVRGIKNKVFIFENPAVFYELLIRNNKDFPSLICISGQPNLAVLSLLDKLAKQGSHLYYSGDFDPEGLQIADNLKYRYGSSLSFLGMNKENYLKIKGDISFAERIGKLDTISSKELQELKEEMKIFGTAGYQELLVEYYLNEIEILMSGNE
ncbi:MAG: TIGR02679 domain-containing protein [Clostridiaceae bacterium]